MMLPSRHRKTAGQTPRQSYNKPQQRHASGNPTCKHVPWRSSRATSAHSRHRRRQRPGPGWHDAHRARLTTPRAISRHRAHLSSGQPSIHQERASSFTPIGHATPPHPPGCCLHSSSTRAPSATIPVFISSHLSPPRSFAFFRSRRRSAAGFVGRVLAFPTLAVESCKLQVALAQVWRHEGARKEKAADYAASHARRLRLRGPRQVPAARGLPTLQTTRASEARG